MAPEKTTPQPPVPPQPPVQSKLSEAQPSSPFKSKGIVIAMIIVIVAVIIGVSALIGLGSTSQYQGYIKKIEDQTQELQQGN